MVGIIKALYLFLFINSKADHSIYQLQYNKAYDRSIHYGKNRSIKLYPKLFCYIKTDLSPAEFSGGKYRDQNYADKPAYSVNTYNIECVVVFEFKFDYRCKYISQDRRCKPNNNSP